MERNEFIKSLGLGVALICTGSCLSGCGKKSDDPGPSPGGGGNSGGGNGGGGGSTGNKVNIDLSSQLLNVNSFVVTSGVLFIRLAAANDVTSFAATQAVCPHQGGSLNWVAANNLIQCSLHSSQYASNGSIITQPNDGGTTSALKTYPLSISGNTLTATLS
ncbi:hypothetical protein D9M68_501410 [compost metagenome]